jgi:hypothetical protein
VDAPRSRHLEGTEVKRFLLVLFLLLLIAIEPNLMIAFAREVTLTALNALHDLVSSGGGANG